ncbi:type I-B CRISPR-associated protein Cas7/Cst2/DevR [Bacteroidales bacterium]|nr:type I-B CRISPR-associated protein Cas7/Cst2/DevR [Bacteroidales bacterium]
MKAELKNIAGCLIIDATGAFLNGAGLGAGEDRNLVIPKTFKEKVNGKNEEVPYVSAQAWRRWLRNTSNEENGWTPSELASIKTSEKGSTTKISTELDPIIFPEDDLFGYMKSGDAKAESIQRTSPFKTSILKGVKNLRALSRDDAFVHLKEGTPLPYSTRFYSAHLEGFFNLEYYRLGVYDNLGSRQELATEFVEKHADSLDESALLGKFKRYTLKNADQNRKERAAGLLKGLSFLRGGAKQAAFGSDVSPKVLIIAGLSTANPIFNNLFLGGERPVLNIDVLKQLAADYSSKLATPIYIGIRKGYLLNEKDVEALGDLDKKLFVIGSPISIVEDFKNQYLS